MLNRPEKKRKKKKKKRNMARIKTKEPTRGILALLSSVNSSNAHLHTSNGARCLIFGRTLCLLPYFMCANSEGSGETARMHRLA